MARSQVTICNRALDILGSESITSMSDSSTQARAMSRAWDPVLDSLLNKHNWSFAKKRISLAQSATTPVYEYGFQYALPTDYIRIVEVYPRYTKHKVESGFILTHADQLYILYISRVTDPNQFSPEFAELLSKFLAKETCFKITQSRSKEQDLEKACEKYFVWAAGNDSKMSGTAEVFADDDWMIQRGYGPLYEADEAVVAENFNYGQVD